MKPERFANIPTEVYWPLGHEIRNQIVQLGDDNCWKAQLPKIEMEFLSNGKLRVHKEGNTENTSNPDESDALMLAFMELSKKRVKFHYEGGGGLGDDFWDDEIF